MLFRADDYGFLRISAESNPTQLVILQSDYKKNILDLIVQMDVYKCLICSKNAKCHCIPSIAKLFEIICNVSRRIDRSEKSKATEAIASIDRPNPILQYRH